MKTNFSPSKDGPDRAVVFLVRVKLVAPDVNPIEQHFS